MSNPSQSERNSDLSAKQVPPGADSLAAAGPYSPVLEVAADRLVVISGQVAFDSQKNIVGDNIEVQTRTTLANCARHLEAAGCTLDDVFKVNAYLANLDDWAGFNAVYSDLVPEPRPARTTIGARLLPGLLVEIEMWAAKRGE